MDSEQNNGKIQQIGGGIWHKQEKPFQYLREMLYFLVLNK